MFSSSLGLLLEALYSNLFLIAIFVHANFGMYLKGLFDSLRFCARYSTNVQSLCWLVVIRWCGWFGRRQVDLGRISLVLLPAMWFYLLLGGYQVEAIRKNRQRNIEPLGLCTSSKFMPQHPSNTQRLYISIAKLRI